MGVRDLDDSPWDAVVPYRERAAQHPDGIVDLSIGSPVDPTPEVIRRALAEATDAHAYPQTVGTPALREAIVDWYARRRGVPDLSTANVLPTIGSKELVALLPTLLGLGPGDIVVHPTVAYPTYEVGAKVAGATPVAMDDPAAWARLRHAVIFASGKELVFRLRLALAPGEAPPAQLGQARLGKTAWLAPDPEKELDDYYVRNLVAEADDIERRAA